MKLPALLGFITVLMSQAVNAQVEFKPAYRTERADCVPVAFQNVSSFRFVSNRPIIASSEMREAVPVQADGATYLTIKITAGARERINALASVNSKAIREKKFDETVGLGVVVNETPRTVIQGLFQQIKKDEMRWYTSTNARPIDLREAIEMASLINNAISMGK